LGHNIDKPLTFGTGYIEISLVLAQSCWFNINKTPHVLGTLSHNITDKPLTFGTGYIEISLVLAQPCWFNINKTPHVLGTAQSTVVGP
jgi:transcription antitermination factor NusG